jgi:hypothetical protein
MELDVVLSRIDFLQQERSRLKITAQTNIQTILHPVITSC